MSRFSFKRLIFICVYHISMLRRKLAVIQVGVEAALIKECYMVALFYNMTVLHDKYDIRILDGGESVGYDKACTSFHHGIKCLADLKLCSGIDGGCGLIEYQHRRKR